MTHAQEIPEGFELVEDPVPEGFELVSGPEQFGPPAPPRQPTIGERVNRAFTGAIGAPVDLVTFLINKGAESLGLGQVIDPRTVPLGSQSLIDFGEGGVIGLENIGRGIQNTLRGVGANVDLISDLTPEERTAQREFIEGSPSAFVGELAGEVAPFILPAAKIGQIASRVTRILLSGAGAAAEGALISSGRGATGEEIAQASALGGGLAIGLESTLPVLGRVAGALFRRLRGREPQGALITPQGTPTTEFQQALDGANIRFEDLQAETLSQIRTNVDPEQVARAARFREQGIPTTRGVITQEDVLLGQEQTLLGRIDPVGSQIAAPLRERRIETSAGFIRNLENLITDLGISDDVGQSIKDALSRRRRVVGKIKNRYYTQAANADPGLLNAPILTDGLLAAVPDIQAFRRFERLKPTEARAFRELLVEFGIDTSDDSIARFTRNPNNIITPLSFSNFEDFRQALNSIVRADQTGTTATQMIPFINALDGELDTAFKAISEAEGFLPQSLDILMQARQAVREIKVEFDPKGVVQKLIANQRKSFLPVIETSEVFRTILRPSTSPETTRRLINSLNKSGKPGERAIGNLQAATVFQALDAALSTASSRSGGQQLFNPTAFLREFNKLGDGKLAEIFAGNSAALAQIRSLVQSAQDLIVPGTTLPKGSAPAVNAALGFLTGIRNLPLIRGVSDAVKTGVDFRNTRAILEMKPQQRAAIQYINREFPALASALGVVIVTGRSEDNDN